MSCCRCCCCCNNNQGSKSCLYFVVCLKLAIWYCCTDRLVVCVLRRSFILATRDLQVWFVATNARDTYTHTQANAFVAHNAPQLARPVPAVICPLHAVLPLPLISFAAALVLLAADNDCRRLTLRKKAPPAQNLHQHQLIQI